MMTKFRPLTDRIVLYMNEDMTVFIKNYQYYFVKKIKERHIDDKKKINQKKESDDKNR